MSTESFDKEFVLGKKGLEKLEEWAKENLNDIELSWNEVLQGLKEGKKYKRKLWSNNVYIKSVYNTIMFYLDNKLNKNILFVLYDFEAIDWVEVK